MTSRSGFFGILLLIALAAANARCTLGPTVEDFADVSHRRVLADASRSARSDAEIPEPDAFLPVDHDADGLQPDGFLPIGHDAGGPEPDASLPPATDAGGPEPDASLPPVRDAGGAGPDASLPPFRDAGGQVPDASLPSPRDAGNPTVEVCDGIDNDRDRIVDNVDVGRDGVCDCLRIATLGYPGTWGTGDVFQDWLYAKINGAVVSLGAEMLSPQALAPFQIIVVQDVRADSPGSQGPGNGIGRAYSEAEIEALTDWVDRGGGLFTLSGYWLPSELGNVNKMLAPFGLSYESRTIFKGTGSAVPISHWSKHPISEGVQAVEVYGAYPVAGGSLLAWEPEPGNWDIGRISAFGSGRVFAWGDEWISYTSRWDSDLQVERLWLNSLSWLTIAGHCQVPTSPNR